MRFVSVLVVGLLLVRVDAFAQQTTASIGGTVKDATGAVLPGVTVEAASPALIEKVRSAVTDGSGNFKIVDLRPGTYSVTFTLPGFGTVRREGIELTGDFTATANAELKVGTLEETVIVAGASPIVDVQNSRAQRVLSSQVLDSLPSGQRDLTQIASLTLGAINGQAGRNDVGGDHAEQSNSVTLHGGRGDDGRTNYDGMGTNIFTGTGGGQRRIYKFNTVGVDEIVLNTGGSSAENENGGATVNMVPRDGGNVFKFQSIDNFTSTKFASGKVPSDLVARGSAPNQNAVKKIWDTGIGIGGPFVKDRLWFYTANRWWGSQAYAANNYFNSFQSQVLYIPDLSRPAYSDNHIVDDAVRLTWQARAKHKVTFSINRQAACSCWFSISGGALSAPEADNSFKYGDGPSGSAMYLTQGTYTLPATNRLLVQVGVSFIHQPWFRDGTDKPGPDRHSTLELSTGYTYGAKPGALTNDYGVGDPQVNDNFNQRFSVSYITGSHAMKIGGQTLEGRYETNGNVLPDGVTYTFRNQLPVSLTQWATPFVSKNRIRSLGMYAQDQWTVHRLTINGGLRFDHFLAYALAVTKPAGPFTGAVSLPRVDDLPNYKDITPRIGAAYDIFGNGKTAIKGSWGIYLEGQGAGTLDTVAPANAIVPNVTRTWNDVNGNFKPDCVLTDFSANGECGAINNALFGTPVINTTWADESRKGWGIRPYNQQITAQLQHELRPNVGLTVGYFRTWWANQQVTQNTAVSPTDYTSYCVTAPTDSRLPGGGSNQICGLFDVNPNKFGQAKFLITNASDFGTMKEIFNGVEFGFNARFGKGTLLQGGATLGREVVDTCDFNNFPNVLVQAGTQQQPRSAAFCHTAQPLWSGVGSQIKIQGVYPLPWDFQASGTYKNLPGIPQTANLTVTNAQVATSLGRNLAACPAVGACTATVTLPIIPAQVASTLGTVYGTQFDTRLNEVDLRLAKTFRLAKGRLQGMLDLYNAFNNRPVQGINTTYGATWLKPTAILGGRLLKFGMQLDF